MIGTVSQKVLTAQFREAGQSGLLVRTIYPEGPLRVEYTLTKLGYSLRPILDAMWNWARSARPSRGEFFSCLEPRKSWAVDSGGNRLPCSALSLVKQIHRDIKMLPVPAEQSSPAKGRERFERIISHRATWGIWK